MSGIADRIPLTCPRRGCDRGDVFADFQREIGDVVRYQVIYVDSVCSTGHTLTDEELFEVGQEAGQIAALWEAESLRGAR